MYCRHVSVRPSVCHKSAFCRQGWTNWGCFGHLRAFFLSPILHCVVRKFPYTGCHPAEMTFPDLPQQRWYSIERPRRDARLSWPSWLLTYRDGIPARRRSPIPVLTGPDVGQLRSLNAANHHASPSVPVVLLVSSVEAFCRYVSHQWKTISLLTHSVAHV